MRTVILWVAMLGPVIFGAMLEGLHLSALNQPTSAIIVFGPIVAYLFFGVGPRQTLDLLRRIANQKLLPQDTAIFDKVSTLGFLTGGLCAILGLIHVMGNLSDSSKLGAGIAVAFIGVFYGALPCLLLTALPSKTGPTVVMKRSAQSYAAASVLVLLLSFFVILYALSSTDRSSQHNRSRNDIEYGSKDRV